MKKCVLLLWLSVSILSVRTLGQSDETQQLLLNVEKLAQLKKILHNMYQGYQLISKGYNTIKDISQGNFDMHKNFLDGLLAVSPSVKKYKRIADIIHQQSQLVKEYKSAFTRFKTSNLFNSTEIKYMENVYKNLFNNSLQNLDDLAMIVTVGKLRMSDDERMTAIDRVFDDVSDKLNFLRTFNKENNILALQRGREMFDTKVSKQLNGL